MPFSSLFTEGDKYLENNKKEATIHIVFCIQKKEGNLEGKRYNLSIFDFINFLLTNLLFRILGT